MDPMNHPILKKKKKNGTVLPNKLPSARKKTPSATTAAATSSSLSRSWKRNITNANFNHNLNNHHRSMIVQPDPNDVLLGRGKSHNTWPGNMRLNELNNKYHDEYIAAKLADKKRITTHIVEEIQKHGGRFLKKGRRQHQHCWIVIQPETARVKVAHALQYLTRKSAPPSSRSNQQQQNSGDDIHKHPHLNDEDEDSMSGDEVDRNYKNERKENTNAASRAKVTVDNQDDDEIDEQCHLSAEKAPNISQTSECTEGVSDSLASGETSMMDCYVPTRKSLITPEVSEFIFNLRNPPNNRNAMGDPNRENPGFPLFESKSKETIESKRMSHSNNENTLEFLTYVAVWKDMVEEIPPLPPLPRRHTFINHDDDFDNTSFQSLNDSKINCPLDEDRPISPLNPEDEVELFDDNASIFSGLSVFAANKLSRLN